MTGDDYPLRWDYTLASLERLAHQSVKACPWKHLPWTERYDAAYSAIAVAMYGSEKYIRPGELIRLGSKAIERDVLDRFQMRGVHRTGDQLTYRRKFMAFWWSQGAPTPSPEDRIVESIAVHEIFGQLSRGRRRALLALAVHEDYAAAAESLGISANAFKLSVARARSHFYRLWHEGEKPARVWGADIRPKTPRAKSITYTTIRERRKTRERRRGR